MSSKLGRHCIEEGNPNVAKGMMQSLSSLRYRFRTMDVRWLIAGLLVLLSAASVAVQYPSLRSQQHLADKKLQMLTRQVQQQSVSAAKLASLAASKGHGLLPEQKFHELPAALTKALNAAELNHWEMSFATIQRSKNMTDAASAPVVHEVSVDLDGRYTEVSGLLSDILVRFPNVALTSVQFQRDKGQQGMVQAKATLQAYYAAKGAL